MSTRNLAPPGKRRGGPRQEAALNVAVTTTDTTIVTDNPVTTSEPHWTGCPMGCGQYGHEPPCTVGRRLALVDRCNYCTSLDVAAREALPDCSSVCPARRAVA